MDAPATVLHVDDDQGLLRLVQEMFNEAAPDLSYVPAADAEEAIEALQDLHPPVLLLVDRRLPQTDMWAFVDRVADELGLVSIPTFILSGSQDPEAIDEAYAHGAVAYLEKPIDAEGFSRIARLLDRYTQVATFPGPQR